MLECWDRKNKDYVAIKIVRNVQKYRDAAMIEVRSAVPLRPGAPASCTLVRSPGVCPAPRCGCGACVGVRAHALCVWRAADVRTVRQLEVLNTLERNDPEGRFHCVSLREWFDYRGHVCMVFEKLGLSLYDFLRKNSYSPFPAAMVRPLQRRGPQQSVLGPDSA